MRDEEGKAELAPAQQPAQAADAPKPEADEDTEVRCTLCGLRACWSSR